VNRLSELEGAVVMTEIGERLGHVFEIRSPGDAGTQPEQQERRIDCLLCGRLGLFERLGWKEPQARAIPWSLVLELRDRKVIVSGSARDYDGLAVR
jgi:hypothetical protein